MTLTIQNKAEIVPFDDSKVSLLKNTICKGSTDDEFELFLHACKRTGLDPFMRQIQAVKRWDSSMNREAMSIQVGIDGYRLIADRTGRYAPGGETKYNYDSKGCIVSATAFCKKQTADGTWHEVSATAYYVEYVAMKKDKTPTAMWATKPHIMLGKCAEALCLRKAFPAELSGVYTSEEMEQASNPIIKKQEEKPRPLPITNSQAQELQLGFVNCSPEYQDTLFKSFSTMNPQVNCFEELPANLFERVKTAINKNAMEYQQSLTPKSEELEVVNA